MRDYKTTILAKTVDSIEFYTRQSLLFKMVNILFSNSYSRNIKTNFYSFCFCVEISLIHATSQVNNLSIEITTLRQPSKSLMVKSTLITTKDSNLIMDVEFPRTLMLVISLSLQKTLTLLVSLNFNENRSLTRIVYFSRL